MKHVVNDFFEKRRICTGKSVQEDNFENQVPNQENYFFEIFFSESREIFKKEGDLKGSGLGVKINSSVYVLSIVVNRSTNCSRMKLSWCWSLSSNRGLIWRSSFDNFSSSSANRCFTYCSILCALLLINFFWPVGSRQCHVRWFPLASNWRILAFAKRLRETEISQNVVDSIKTSGVFFHINWSWNIRKITRFLTI